MDKIKFLMSGVWAFLLPTIKVFLSDIGPILIATATNIIANLASSDMTGPEKKEAAMKALTDAMLANGVEVATHIIDTTIQAAVTKLKADQ